MPGDQRSGNWSLNRSRPHHPAWLATANQGKDKTTQDIMTNTKIQYDKHKKPDKIETKVNATMKMEGFWVKFQLWHQTKPISQLVMVWICPPPRICSSRKTLMKPEMVQFFKTFGWRTENSPSFLRLTRYQRNFEPYPTITQVMRNWGTTISFPLRSNNVKLSLWELCSIIALYCTTCLSTIII